jgi:ABC-type transport system involved in multi-copper enzyme maturation permease subunit
MTVLPIVARELRAASRRRGTVWWRASAATAVLGVGVWSYLAMADSSPAGDIGQALFGIMAGSAAAYCLLGGPLFTADCLSREKRDGTLGLLFLTDLRGYDVVLGKLAATSLNAAYGVLAIVPLLAVPLLLGGVTLDEVARMALVIVNTLYFSLTAGICVSAISRSARKAVLGTGTLLLLLTCVPPLATRVWNLVSVPSLIPLLMPSPAFTLIMAFEAAYKVQPEAFWGSLGTTHLLGWLFLGTACALAPRVWQDKPAGRSLGLGTRLEFWAFDPEERRAFRARLLAQNPYFWLAARARLRPALVWAAFAVASCLWLAGLAKEHRDWLDPFNCFLSCGLLNGLVKVWLAVESGRQLAEDRHAATLEAILTTPLSVREILKGQFLALQRQFLGPLAVTLAVFLLAVPVTLSHSMDEESRALWVSVYAAAMISLVADAAALHWIGMWLALKARNSQRAILGAIARVLLLPWIALALGLVLLNSLPADFPGAGFSPGGPLLVGLWLAMGLAIDLGFGAWARFKLLAGFRRRVAEGYAPAVTRRRTKPGS